MEEDRCPRFSPSDASNRLQQRDASWQDIIIAIITIAIPITIAAPITSELTIATGAKGRVRGIARPGGPLACSAVGS